MEDDKHQQRIVLGQPSALLSEIGFTRIQHQRLELD